jgi:cytochrome c oxidase subunit 2
MPAALRRLGLIISVLAPLAFPAAALASALAPQDGGSPNADKINTLYWIIFALGALVFVGVMGALLYSIIKFRARKGAVAAQIRGNTRLEIGWTVGAALILVVLAIVTFIFLPGIENPPNSDANGINSASNGGILYASGPEKRLPPNGKSLNICVNGQQYIWRFTYAKNCQNAPLDSVFSYEEMVVPVGTTVTLDINSQDVDHSWWIPQLGGKFDAIPGYTNHTWFKVPEKLAGSVFAGQCAELCGRNHANMRAQVHALAPSDFEAWLASKKQQIKEADAAAAISRKRLEANPTDANP